MSVLLFFLYLAIAVFVYSGLMLRVIHWQVMTSSKGLSTSMFRHRRFRYYLVAFIVATLVILACLIAFEYNL